jgi:hypothetical protein
MAVVWTTEADETETLTAASVQDLIDELEADERALYRATKVVCGGLEFSPRDFKVERAVYQEGLLQGLKIAQELGVP